MSASNLPERLYVACEWITAAGEVYDLALMNREQAQTYAKEAAANFAKEGGDAWAKYTLAESDIMAFYDWMLAK
jgi:hypothetical protein